MTPRSISGLAFLKPELRGDKAGEVGKRLDCKEPIVFLKLKRVTNGIEYLKKNFLNDTEFMLAARNFV